jgi:tetratricopeptide (TPR) repeat protein
MKPGSRSDLFAVARRASSSAGVFAAVLAAVLPGTAGLRAQNLELRTAPPPAVQMVCPWTPGEAVTPPAPGSAAAGEMERLTGAATQAMILGDLPGALEFLDRALERDPDAPEALYLRGRILVEQGDDDAATASFCRYLQVGPWNGARRRICMPGSRRGWSATPPETSRERRPRSLASWTPDRG